MDTQRNAKGQFVQGVSGNANGRPKGSRNQLGEAFIADLYEDWLAHGVATIEQVRVDDPASYLKVVASILPKDLNFNVSLVENMTNDELNDALERLLADPDLVAARQAKITHRELE